jgi:hypothetical protein
MAAKAPTNAIVATSRKPASTTFILHAWTRKESRETRAERIVIIPRRYGSDAKISIVFQRSGNPIPEEMDHREIAVRVPVMNEVQFLFPSEPCKPVKSRSLYVVFLVEKDMRVERRRTCDCLNQEEIDWQYEVCTRSHQKHRNEEEGCIVAFVTEVRR